MPAEKSEVSPDQWLRLYGAARAFQERAPWRQLTDSDVFAVATPDGGEPFYCVVMGAGGMEYGLLACPGPFGLTTLESLYSTLDSDERVVFRECLSFSMGDRVEIDARDRAVHEALGLHFRGRGAWPVFRSVRSNYIPAQLQANETVDLANCLEQACAFADHVAAGTPASPGPGRFFARIEREDGTWETSVVDEPPRSTVPEFDSGRMQHLVDTAMRVQATFQVRMILAGRVRGERGSPDFFGRSLLCVESKSGQVLMPQVLGPEDHVVDALIDTLLSAGVVPERLEATSELLLAQLGPLAQTLGIELKLVKRLPKLDSLARTLTSRFG